MKIGNNINHDTVLVELTAKNLKILIILSWIMMILGFMVRHSNDGFMHDTGGVLMLLAFLLFVVTKIRIYWNHS
jgi:hypothetical protein